MRALTGLALAIAATAIGVPTASADAGTPSPPTQRVTLITGDQVEIRDGIISVEPAEGREEIPFATVRGPGGHVSVIPADAQPLLAADRLDRRLFDVTGLLTMGYGDADASTLPLITQAEGRSAGFAVQAVDKKDLAQRWAAQARSLGGRVWLDGKRTVLDTMSTRQIAAQQAWAKGLTGKGVTVAVLDTGADATHPDLAGAITAAKDFTGSGERDGHGHGTHVAATIAGRGAQHPSVAPEATLAIGKVLNNAGQGQDSWIMAGMQWAATEAKAKVINLSLGHDDTQGTDPLEAAVEELSASTGALFVIAAGNSGPDERTLASPASAPSALAIGAVDSADALAGFSSRGPRIGDYGVKPELAAPGVGIVAAQAAGTGFGQAAGEGYAASSGTSMATPHVAGAAAVLAQQHPDWTGEQLKDALIGSARADDFTAFETGAGRLDLGTAVDATVTASPASLSTYVKYGEAAPTRTLTYTNAADHPVTLHLRDDVRAIKLSTALLRVPAHGTASVELTVKASAGVYGGTVTASGDGQSVSTVVGAYVEPEAGDLTVSFVGFDGNPVPGQSAQIVNMATGESDYVDAATGSATVRLPAGEYAMPVYVRTKDLSGKSVAVMANVPVTVREGAQTVTVDARSSAKLDAVLDDDPAARLDFQVLDLNRTLGDTSVTWQTGVTPATVTMVPPAEGRGVVYRHHAVFVPGTASATKNWRADTVDYRLGEVPAVQTHHASLAALDRTETDYRGFSLDRSTAVLRMAPLYPGADSVRLRQTSVALGTTTTHYVENPVPGMQWNRVVGYSGRTGGGYALFDLRALPAGGRDTFAGSAFGPVIGKGEAVRDGDTLTFAPGSLASDAAGHYAISTGTTALTLSQDGTQLAATSGTPLTASVARVPGTYTLALSHTRTGWALPVSSKTETAWTFRSHHTGKATDLRLNTVRIEVGGLNGYNKAAFGSATPVGVTFFGGPAVREVVVEASFDGGATWTAASAGSVSNVASSEQLFPFVTLRVTAVDEEGGKVTQTVTNAYGLS